MSWNSTVSLPDALSMNPVRRIIVADMIFECLIILLVHGLPHPLPGLAMTCCTMTCGGTVTGGHVVRKNKGRHSGRPCIGYRQNSKPVSVLSCHLSSQPTPRQRTGSPFSRRPEPRLCRYIWPCWSWCRHRRMSPHDVVSPCLAVSPLPFRAVCFLLRHS